MAEWSVITEGRNLHLSLSGKKAINPQNGHNYGRIINIDSGRTAEELWIHFEGTSGGKRFSRKKFAHVAGLKIDSTSNTSFINSITSTYQNITRRNTSVPVPVPQERHNGSLEALAIEETESPTEIYAVNTKRIGEYKISIDKLQMAPERISCRSLDREWVEKIKKSIKDAPGNPVTIFPVLIQSSLIDDPSQFRETMIRNSELFILGGNHAIQAFKEIINEEPDNELFRKYGEVMCELYIGLQDEEAKLIGNLHNKRTETLNLTFQNKVIQIRSLFLSGKKDWKELATKVLRESGQSSCSKNSLVTLFSVASYSESLFKETKRIFDTLQTRGIDCPQKVFKALQGLDEDTKVNFMKRISCVSTLNEITKEIKKKKKKNLIKRKFIEITECDEEEVELLYGERLPELELFTGMDFNRGNIPHAFVNFCKDVQNSTISEDISVKIKVKLNGKRIRTEEDEVLQRILKKHKDKIEKEIFNYVLSKKKEE